MVILKRIFRCDTLKNDPNQIKNRLSDIWLTKGCPKNITIAQQPLECDGNLRLSRYGSPSAKGSDGIHMRGVMAVQHYTGSFVNFLLENLPFLTKIQKILSTSPPLTPKHMQMLSRIRCILISLGLDKGSTTRVTQLRPSLSRTQGRTDNSIVSTHRTGLLHSSRETN